MVQIICGLQSFQLNMAISSSCSLSVDLIDLNHIFFFVTNEPSAKCCFASNQFYLFRTLKVEIKQYHNITLWLNNSQSYATCVSGHCLAVKFSQAKKVVHHCIR